VNATRRSILAATLIAVSLTFGCSSSYSAALNTYRIGPNPDQITVSYTVGDGDPAGSIEVVKETSTSVTIKVTYEGSDELRTALGVTKEAVASLKSPLGGRAVLDDKGQQLRPDPRPQPSSS
jgi:hypothetical protein